MTIRWTHPAVADLTHICDYTEAHFGADAASRTSAAVFVAVDSLRNMPKQGRLGRKPGTRELVLSNLPFLVVYRVVGDAVEVVRILHGAQQWP